MNAATAPNAITADQIAPAAITTSEIAPGAVTLGQIAPGAINSTNIVNNSLTVDDLGPNSVGPDELINGTVGLSEMNAVIVEDRSIGTAVMLAQGDCSADIATVVGRSASRDSRPWCSSAVSQVAGTNPGLDRDRRGRVVGRQDRSTSGSATTGLPRAGRPARPLVSFIALGP